MRLCLTAVKLKLQESSVVKQRDKNVPVARRVKKKLFNSAIIQCIRMDGLRDSENLTISLRLRWRSARVSLFESRDVLKADILARTLIPYPPWLFWPPELMLLQLTLESSSQETQANWSLHQKLGVANGTMILFFLLWLMEAVHVAIELNIEKKEIGQKTLKNTIEARDRLWAWQDERSSVTGHF